MSLDQIAFIMENCHACKFEYFPYGMVIKFQLHKGDNWQQIEVEHSIWLTLERRYTKIVNKWIAENEGGES